MAIELPEIKGFIVPGSALLRRLGDHYEVSFAVRSELYPKIESLAYTFSLLSAAKLFADTINSDDSELVCRLS